MFGAFGAFSDIPDNPNICNLLKIMALTSALVRSVARVSRRNVYTSAKLFRKEEEDYPGNLKHLILPNTLHLIITLSQSTNA